MTESHDKFLRDIGKITDMLERSRIQGMNKKKGYEPKCKICNSAFQDEIDDLYDRFTTLTDIKEYLEDRGEEVSIMSLSRHYKKHYPIRKEYKDELKKMEDSAVKEAIETYPRLKEILQGVTEEFDPENSLYYENGNVKQIKTKKIPVIDVFLNKEGYCLTGYKFCSNIPKRKVKDFDEVVSDFDFKLYKLSQEYFSNTDDKIQLLNKKCKCLECKGMYNDFAIDYILEYILKNIIGIDLEGYKFLELMNQEAGWDNEEMEGIINRLKGKSASPGIE